MPEDYNSVGKIELPVMAFTNNREAVIYNRRILDAFKDKLNAALKAVSGMSKANQALCEHDNKQQVNDPGYAGGGFSHYHCTTCGSNEC